MRDFFGAPTTLGEFGRKLTAWLNEAAKAIRNGLFLNNEGVVLKTYTGITMDASGNATVAHGITNLNLKLWRIESWVVGNSGESVRVNSISVDATNIFIYTNDTGYSGRKAKVLVEYTPTAVQW